MNSSVRDWVIEVEGNDIIGNYKDDDQLDTSPMDPDIENKRILVISKTQNDIFTIGCWL